METQLNREALKELPKKNHTSFLVLKEHSERQRNRQETDIDRYKMQLLYKGFKVDPEQYMQLWKDLEALGAGSIIWGRNGNSSRFRWHYSLKDIGMAAVNPEKVEEIPLVPTPGNVVDIKPKRQYRKKSKRGRPVGSKNKPKESLPGAGIILTIKDADGNTRGITVEEAFRIAEQVNRLKQMTA